MPRADAWVGFGPTASKYSPQKLLPSYFHFDDASDEEGSPILAIYKARDDLRQDAAMLQVMRQMDRMWLDAGLECWLRTYSVCATQPDSGWIEVVSDATETAEVQQTYGGGALGGAFQSNTLNRFLEDKNRDDPRAFPACVERFAASVRPVASLLMLLEWRIDTTAISC